MKCIPFAAAIALALAAGGVLAQKSPPDRAASAARVQPLDRDDRSFAENAFRAGQAEIEHGKLAQQRASHAQVKAYADRMVADHTTSGDELKAIAEARGATLASGVRKDERQKMDKLAKLKGDEFDRAYMRHMVDDHEKVHEMFDRYSKKGKDGDLKSYAVKTVPVLEDHLRQAVAVNDAIKGKK